MIYGTGKCEYIVSLPELCRLLKKHGFICKYCSENIQSNKDGKDTLRVSMIISKNVEIIEKYKVLFMECITKYLTDDQIQKVVWKDLEELF